MARASLLIAKSSGSVGWSCLETAQECDVVYSKGPTGALLDSGRLAV